jgi:hypothetical protein
MLMANNAFHFQNSTTSTSESLAGTLLAALGAGPTQAPDPTVAVGVGKFFH